MEYGKFGFFDYKKIKILPDTTEFYISNITQTDNSIEFSLIQIPEAIKIQAVDIQIELLSSETSHITMSQDKNIEIKIKN